ncbi:MAG: DUF2513 domain-containing protein [Terriglobia bacterium]
MERDMDLIRELLLQVDSNPKLDGTHYHIFNKPIEGHSLQEVTYHVDLLFEAGYVKGTSTSDLPMVTGLTWEGHEFLDHIRDSGVWASIKQRIKGLPGVSIALLGELGKAELMKRLHMR